MHRSGKMQIWDNDVWKSDIRYKDVIPRHTDRQTERKKENVNVFLFEQALQSPAQKLKKLKRIRRSKRNLKQKQKKDRSPFT